MKKNQRKHKPVRDRGAVLLAMPVLPSPGPNAGKSRTTRHRKPAARFKSDIDGVRYMFCAVRDAAHCRVRVWYGNTMDEPEGKPGATFIGYYPTRPGEFCWVADHDATRIELERPDGTVHVI